MSKNMLKLKFLSSDLACFENIAVEISRLIVPLLSNNEHGIFES